MKKLHISRYWLGLGTGALLALAVLLGAGARPTGVSTVHAAVVPQAIVQGGPASYPVMHYQGRLLDPSTGQPRPDGTYQMSFSIYNAASGGSPLWTEAKSVAVSRGTFNTLLGDTQVLNLDLFDGQILYLGITIGADPEATPRQRLAHVAYAVRAENAGALDGQDSTAFAAAGHAHDGSAITSGNVVEARIDATLARDSEVMPTVLANDGPGSTLAADTLDGSHASAFASAGHNHGEFGYLPIAFGFVGANGVLESGTKNVSSLWDAKESRYQITIDYEPYFIANYATVVTPVCSNVMARTDSVSNALLVYLVFPGGAPTQCGFQFVTFKP